MRYKIISQLVLTLRFLTHHAPGGPGGGCLVGPVAAPGQHVLPRIPCLAGGLQDNFAQTFLFQICEVGVAMHTTAVPT